MADPRALYQEMILEHNRKPRNFGALAAATHHAAGHNPLCGDHIEVSLVMQGTTIEQVGFEGEACAICKSSASMMTVAVKGKSQADAELLIREFVAMTTGKLDMNSEHQLGRLKVFAGIADLPVRVKCAILPWHTLHAAIHAIDGPSTEADQDPMHVMIGDA
ncbi:SUF system NifU family Fe-S cluster assembly protein [Actimicrobium sp. CCC2.4]|uniref:Fe-S cluster assembly sulfur transfer protein SufU n=1 Tax=Actimicrobium sp. CCC2.4 TaxID=3048606 RepID=UPI002AC9A740|nr:SUF system NifU family Fe-S cluster assembly protein [Actimicrobium sp. CCC2.4]MEB0135736.1 SUF system NifU family Fe-S cluster assembly protein [Actimicrobium sp. CCC2.4]WPX33707.1 SUF system NifU family Fe-S cluster assembly protein [Actimicrobium sp. CCC2.4]